MRTVDAVTPQNGAASFRRLGCFVLGQELQFLLDRKTPARRPRRGSSLAARPRFRAGNEGAASEMLGRLLHAAYNRGSLATVFRSFMSWSLSEGTAALALGERGADSRVGSRHLEKGSCGGSEGDGARSVLRAQCGRHRVGNCRCSPPASPFIVREREVLSYVSHCT